MQPAGLAAFAKRTARKSGIYAYEQRHQARLDPRHEQRFRAARRAWTFFTAQPPSYRQVAIYWVVSAKRDETRRTRLEKLMRESAAGRRIR